MAVAAISFAPKSVTWRMLVSALEGALCSQEQALELSSTAEDVIRQHLNASDLLHGLQLELDTSKYQRLLLHADPRGRFCVLALVWAPSSATPVHSHRTWCAVGVASGELYEERYAHLRAPHAKVGELVDVKRLTSGQTTHENSCGGFVHRLANRSSAFAISLHTYGVSADHIDDGVNEILI
jgi:3-mercaptopropionate dioxygenase